MNVNNHNGFDKTRLKAAFLLLSQLAFSLSIIKAAVLLDLSSEVILR